MSARLEQTLGHIVTVTFEGNPAQPGTQQRTVRGRVNSVTHRGKRAEGISLRVPHPEWGLITMQLDAADIVQWRYDTPAIGSVTLHIINYNEADGTMTWLDSDPERACTIYLYRTTADGLVSAWFDKWTPAPDYLAVAWNETWLGDLFWFNGHRYRFFACSAGRNFYVRHGEPMHDYLRAVAMPMLEAAP